MPLSPENVIPAPSQSLPTTRPWLDQTPALALTRIAPVAGLAPGHCPANIVTFDRPVVTPERGDSPSPAFNDRAVSHPPVITLAGDGR